MYKAIHFNFDPFNTEFIELLSALLDIHNFDGIFEDEKGVIAYIHEEKMPENILPDIQSKLFELGCELSWKIKDIPKQNWNEIWESNFEPITIRDQCVIRAPFHGEIAAYRYQILIEPKMSFGTGHHQTTRLMIEHMLEMDFKDRTVLDMGCGTGVLGILAKLKKALKVVAVDIDTWAVENAKENVDRNIPGQMTVLHGGTETVLNESFDIILANINRNVLLEQIKYYSEILKPTGILLLSGIFTSDIPSVRAETEKFSFNFIKTSELDEWAAAMFQRN